MIISKRQGKTQELPEKRGEVGWRGGDKVWTREETRPMSFVEKAVGEHRSGREENKELENDMPPPRPPGGLKEKTTFQVNWKRKKKIRILQTCRPNGGSPASSKKKDGEYSHDQGWKHGPSL